MKESQPVIITQILKTIQGEGIHVGLPVILIRLSGCNLDCSFCDARWSNEIVHTHTTSATRPSATSSSPLPSQMTATELAHNIEEQISNTGITTLMITGGEPFLYTSYLHSLLSHLHPSKINAIEIESNGTLISDRLNAILQNHQTRFLFHINISPKLQSSAYKGHTNFNDIICEQKKSYSTLCKVSVSHSYKFVFSAKWAKDIEAFIQSLGLKHSDVLLMPLTPPREQFLSEDLFLKAFRQSCFATINYAITNGFRVSPREHLFIFGDDLSEKSNQ